VPVSEQGVDTQMDSHSYSDCRSTSVGKTPVIKSAPVFTPWTPLSRSSIAAGTPEAYVQIPW